MNVKVDMKCGNSAFVAGRKEVEVVRILRDLAKKVEEGGIDDYPCKDGNGNTVGHLVFEDIEPTCEVCHHEECDVGPLSSLEEHDSICQECLNEGR